MILSYARVSTVEQAADGSTSIGEQQRKNKAIAQLRGSDAFSVAEYVDPGISGSVPLADRPFGGQMLADAKPGDCIVAVKLDRLFRSAIDALRTAEQLRERGIDLILVDMGTEPVTGNGAAKLFFGMLSIFAEFERERITERTVSGRIAKRHAGGHLGGSPPYGWQVEGEGRQSKLVAIEAEQVTIAVIKKLWHEHTPASACREALRLGLKDRAGSPFRINQLQRIAEREVKAAA